MYYCCPVDTRMGYYVGFSRDRVYIVGLVGHSAVLGAPSAGVRAPTTNSSTEVRLWTDLSGPQHPTGFPEAPGPRTVRGSPLGHSAFVKVQHTLASKLSPHFLEP